MFLKGKRPKERKTETKNKNKKTTSFMLIQKLSPQIYSLLKQKQNTYKMLVTGHHISQASLQQSWGVALAPAESEGPLRNWECFLHLFSPWLVPFLYIVTWKWQFHLKQHTKASPPPPPPPLRPPPGWWSLKRKEEQTTSLDYKVDYKVVIYLKQHREQNPVLLILAETQEASRDSARGDLSRAKQS